MNIDVNNVKDLSNIKQSTYDLNTIGVFNIDLSFTQIDSSLNKLVINLTSSTTSQGTSFFVPRYTRLQNNNVPIKSFIKYTEVDDKNNPLTSTEKLKKQLELFTSKSNLEKYMNKFKSNFELTTDQKNTIKNNGDLKYSIGITNTETVFENNAKFVLKNIIFNNPNASFLYVRKESRKMPSYIKVNSDIINTILSNVIFSPDRFSSKNIEDNIVQEIKNQNLKKIKKEIDKDIKNITDIYDSNESSKSLLAEINKRRDLLFLYLNYKIRAIQETLKYPGINKEETLNNNIKKIWDSNISNSEEFKKFNIGINFNEFSNEVKQLDKEFKKKIDLRIKKQAKYKLIVIINPALIVLVPEKPLNPFQKDDRIKIKNNAKKYLLSKYQSLKKNCKRQGNAQVSLKQQKIIDTCKKICENEKNCRWCDLCSSIVNCSMDETITSKCREKKKADEKKADEKKADEKKADEKKADEKKGGSKNKLTRKKSIMRSRISKKYKKIRKNTKKHKKNTKKHKKNTKKYGKYGKYKKNTKNTKKLIN